MKVGREYLMKFIAGFSNKRKDPIEVIVNITKNNVKLLSGDKPKSPTMYFS
tara:strand:+ start:1149 stop:1301 length:153 start_codon:yes stop_codon:yes gene_type:complete